MDGTLLISAEVRLKWVVFGVPITRHAQPALECVIYQRFFRILIHILLNYYLSNLFLLITT